jgi:hypothetical protein
MSSSYDAEIAEHLAAIREIKELRQLETGLSAAELSCHEAKNRRIRSAHMRANGLKFMTHMDPHDECSCGKCYPNGRRYHHQRRPYSQSDPQTWPDWDGVPAVLSDEKRSELIRRMDAQEAGYTL